MSSKYTNFYSAGQLWNRVPDEIYIRKNIEENIIEFYYTFLDIQNVGVDILANEEMELIDLVEV